MIIRLLVLTAVLFSLLTSDLAAQRWRLLIPVQAYTMQVNQQDPNKLYIGNWANQLYRSDDGGASWYIKEMGSTSSVSYTTSLVVSSVDSNVIVAGGFIFIGIKRSTDGGETWETVLRDENQRRMWFISEAIIEDPQEPSTLYAARSSTFNSVWKSTDIGATWDSVGVIDTEITGRLCTISARPDSSSILYVGCQGGIIFRSDDAGVNWRQVPVVDTALSIKEDSEIPKIVFSKRNPQIGYAVVTIASEVNIEGNGGILKTTNGGASWNRVAFSDTSFWAVEVRPTPESLVDEVVVGGFRTSRAPTSIKGDSLIYRSQDGGETWSELMDISWQPNELEETLQNVWVLRWDAIGEKLYMATQLGLYVLDEETSIVDESPMAAAGLAVTVLPEAVIVRDASPLPSDRSWSIYTMGGTAVATGQITTPSETHVNTTSLPSGRYLLTWGSERAVRTALFTIVR